MQAHGSLAKQFACEDNDAFYAAPIHVHKKIVKVHGGDGDGDSKNGSGRDGSAVL